MDLTQLFKRVGKVAADNSPAILTAIGVTGTLSTAYLAAKAAFKSADVLKEAESDKAHENRLKDYEENSDLEHDPNYKPDGELTAQEKFEAVWKLYAPAAASAAMTIAAIVCANRINDRRTAALASAYSVVEKSYQEYRTKTVEKVGKKKEQEVRDEIAQERINRKPVNKSVLIVTNRGETLCQDAWSGRYFTSSRNLVDKAVNEFNSQLNKNGYASLSEFWTLLDIPATSESDYIGWSDKNLLELDWSGVIDPDDEPALSFAFRTMPYPRFASAY